MALFSQHDGLDSPKKQQQQQQQQTATNEQLWISQTTTIVRWLPLHGACLSRKAAADLVKANRVTVNGLVVEELCHPVASNDSVMVDETLIPHPPTTQHVHIMMNKAPNTLCGRNNATQLKGGGSKVDARPTVHDGMHPGVQCMGRLDVDTTGLLLFTSDGLLNHALVHPSFKVPKVYQCMLRDRRTPLTQEAIDTLQNGLILPNGHLVHGKAWNHETDVGVTFCEITNGYQHQVKHMMAHVKRPLALLHRCSFAGLELDTSIVQGEWRHLTDDEVKKLYALANQQMVAVANNGSKRIQKIMDPPGASNRVDEQLSVLSSNSSNNNNNNNIEHNSSKRPKMDPPASWEEL
jgi:pseudouridine synthase